jgi:hypothetical protein
MIYFYSICTLLFLLANLYYILNNKNNGMIMVIFLIQITLTLFSLFFADFYEAVRTTSAIGSCCFIIISSKIKFN